MHSRIVFFEILARGAVHVLLLLFAFRIAQDISHTRTCTSARIFARPLSRARAPRRAATSGTLYTVTPYSRNSVLSPLDSSLATSPPGTEHSAHALEPLSLPTPCCSVSEHCGPRCTSLRSHTPRRQRRPAQADSSATRTRRTRQHTQRGRCRSVARPKRCPSPVALLAAAACFSFS